MFALFVSSFSIFFCPSRNFLSNYFQNVISCLLKLTGLPLFHRFPVLHLQDSSFHFLTIALSCGARSLFVIALFRQGLGLFGSTCITPLQSLVGSMCVTTFWRVVLAEWASCYCFQSLAIVPGAWTSEDGRTPIWHKSETRFFSERFGFCIGLF